MAEHSEGVRSDLVAGHVSFDWDKAVIVVRVPVWHTASSSIQEVELNFCQLAELLACHFVVNDDKTISGDGRGLVPLAFQTDEP